MKEHNRLRIERLAVRYARRIEEARAPAEADFLREFDNLRERVLRPQMEEFAAELSKAGHAPRLVIDEGHDTPSIELALGLREAKASRNVVGFCVIRWTGYPLQILAYLEVNPTPFDLERFARAADVGPDRVEQLLVEAIEQIMVCNAP
ncbi:hypothetical protein BE04_10175 [Sorangium cellulosum]|uniref:Uncharacterized protein n=2 Tax=Sorangium cellulosum TaxID=56 RepID=A0A150P7C5_SORCE|nr:hypothetical protein [Sorangium cellulosum]AGP35578.1 hypothetical protein SCE1572_14195 [Sorangium cellulosum So0157-2]KYF51614.1 hypothetical protein BE04_10175 [Sorangium cellulosum]KYG05840.1 hypothetical protein BE21_38210 [Sorangium cellulosum]